MAQSRARKLQLFQDAQAARVRGDTDRALSLFQSVLSIEPEDADACNEIGVIYFQRGQFGEATVWLQKAVELRPDFVRALTNLGACYNEQKDNEHAIECYLEALNLEPNMLDAWANLAKAWAESEEHEMAIYAYQKAISINPEGEFFRGLALVYRKSGRYDRSEQALKTAIEKDPSDHDAHHGLALTYFHQERYAEAIEEFESRLQSKELVSHRKQLHPIFRAPAFDGSQNLSDKTLLLHTEQGFGDSLQFSRFIDLIRPRVNKLVMWTRPGLGRLFKYNFDIAEISENVFNLPAFDLQLSLLSIPYYFDRELKTLETSTPYLAAPPVKDRTLDKPDDKFNVGLVWGASDGGFDYVNKRVPLEQLRPLIEMPGTHWYSLQVGSDRQELQQASKPLPLIDLGDYLNDFAVTARVVEQLDLVISVDTSVAHLTGAMGRPLYVMLKKNPDWRWHADGESTIWYSSARLFRQSSFGDWSSVVSRIERELRLLVRHREESQKP
jgi:Flp pilus assembly protein TadD